MAVFSAIGAAIGTATLGGFMGASGTLLGLNAAAWGAGIGSLLGGVAMNALSTALAGKPDAPSAPAVEQTVQRGVVPRSFVVGNYATAGSIFYETTAGLTEPQDSELFYVVGVALSDIPLQRLHKVWVDDRFCTADPTYTPGLGHRLWPSEVDEDFRAWITFHDGTQTAADPVLLEAASDDYEWTASDVGYGVAYATIVCEADPDAFSGFPQFLFVVEGAPLTEMEKGTENISRDRLSATQIKHLLNGIYYDGELFYGPATPGVTDDVDWDPVIVKCGERVPGAEGWTNAQKIAAFGSTNVPAQYRSGLEIPVNRPVADAISDILTSCNGKLSFTGAEYKLAVGEPGGAVATITDADILITRQRSFSPFLPLAETVNSVIATYPEPVEKWADEESPPLIVPEYEADDGNRRLTTTVQMRSVPYAEQVQRLMQSALAEARRARRLTFTLPPKYTALEPLDVVSVTTSQDRFGAKLFRVDGVSDEPNGSVTVDLTEVDPDDYSYTAGDYTPTGPGTIRPIPPGLFPLAGFGASAVPDRLAIRIFWDGTKRGRGVIYRIYEAGTDNIVTKGSTLDFPSGLTITGDGIQRAGQYEVIARKLKAGGGKSVWTARAFVQAANIGIDLDELDDGLVDVPMMNPPTTRLASDGTARVTFSWSGVAEAASYDLHLSEDGGGFVSRPVNGTSVEFNAIAGLEYAGKVRAVNRLGSVSGFSDTVSIIAALDNVPPPVPEAPTISPGFGTLWLEWPAISAPPDFSFYELVEKTTASRPAVNTTATVFKSLSTSFARTGLDDNVTRYYWVRAVDTSGNRSGWSDNYGSGTTTDAANVSVTNEDIRGIVDATSFAAGIEPVTIIQSGSLPTTKTTSAIVYQGNLYRWDGSKYVNDVQAEQIVGRLVAGQIAAAAIGVEQLAANAVQARHIGVGDFENYLGGEDYEGHWNLGAENTIAASATSQINRFLRLPAGGANIGLARKITVEPGDEIYLSIWVWRSSDFDGDNNSKLRIGDQNGALLAAIAYSATAIPATSWRFLETSFTVPADVTELTPTLWITGTTGHVNVARTGLRKKAKGEFIVDGFLKANHVSAGEVITLTAQIKNAIITDAKIADLSAAKLKAGTALIDSITVNGTALGTVRDRANDPAGRINAASTQIDPGKITISGATSLAGWRGSQDVTRINGGAMDLNSIRVNAINTTDFAAAGLAVFGGDVRSDDYNRATPRGWILPKDGPAEFWNGIRTPFIQDNAVTNADNAGSGPIRHMGTSTWLTISSVSLPTQWHTASIIGHLMVVLRYDPNNYPDYVGIEVRINDILRVGINQASFGYLGGSRYIHHAIAHPGVTAGNVNVSIRMRGCDIVSHQMWALARKK